MRGAPGGGPGHGRVALPWDGARARRGPPCAADTAGSAGVGGGCVWGCDLWRARAHGGDTPETGGGVGSETSLSVEGEH